MSPPATSNTSWVEIFSSPRFLCVSVYDRLNGSMHPRPCTSLFNSSSMLIAALTSRS
ncbi:hypothetical protein PC116_g25918 [Phytophthora cactorum]|nr:hypothetical protein PC116_g25918 [Phytophthora cactorum]